MRFAGTPFGFQRALVACGVTRVITTLCIGTKAAECVDVCPVDCIHPKKDEPDWPNQQQLFINPDECIDCAACEAVCPVKAIFPDDEVPDAHKADTQANADYFK